MHSIEGKLLFWLLIYVGAGRNSIYRGEFEPVVTNQENIGAASKEPKIDMAVRLKQIVTYVGRFYAQ